MPESGLVDQVLWADLICVEGPWVNVVRHFNGNPQSGITMVPVLHYGHVIDVKKHIIGDTITEQALWVV